MRSKLRSIVIVALLLAGCGDDAPVATEWNSLEERPCPEDNILTYENFGEPLFLNFCIGCHGSDVPPGERQNAPLNVNFDTLERIRTRAALIWTRAADQNDTMPPLGGPSSVERTMLGEWLACGAPQNSDLAP